jgi:hypothetical protein
MAKTKKVPAVSVLDRRLLHPFGSPSVSITLKEGGPWELRIVDAMHSPGRLHDMKHNKGWEFVTIGELDGTPEEYGMRVMDGRLVRGEHGREVLMKMDKAVFDRIQQRKTEINEKAVSGKALRESTAQETAVKYGSEAGDAVYSQPVTVTNTRGNDMELEEGG